ncbi:zinc metallopeptidase [Treponema brennaborense]|uniref:Peptidase membrane zinc metallopeptidase n=1 Tax=Treponema brennaborense (strain DSM 12168 / CIP 105900 / DD5/3) TaxID=906968 RepID=F4LNV4_TREBD|nr:zinc metallopeptidase [Treponema brennaborense]AEE17931.1 peptidase membrane zinc metallopeptidase [Treponema brennaborense DSM 12168]
MYFDTYYLILVVPALLLSVWAQFKVKSTFSHFSQQASARGISGAQAAAYLLKANNIGDVKIERVSGNLTDHYDPSSKTLRLSDSVYGKTSIAAIGVAAHETGHAIQHAVHYGPLALRSTLVPIANIGSAAGPVLAVLGIVFSWSFLINLGLLFFACAVLFYLVTLPVEFNASRRAVAILGKSGTLNESELGGVKKVLSAAALTYVASALTAIASFLRLVLISRNRRN